MPFASAKQERWMRANHPAMAARWTSEYGSFKGQKQNFKKSPKSESNESPAPGLPKLKRVKEHKRDFGPLHPSSQKRLKTSWQATTAQADEEDAVEATTGSRPGKMKLKKNHVLDPLAKRDVKRAGRKA